MPDAGHMLLAIVQALLLLAAAPLVSGCSRTIRARMHSRHGPGLLQDYRDLFKLMTRQDVFPPAAGWAFRTMPVIVMTTLLVIAMGLPMLTRFAPVPAVGNLITTIYLLALVRFFFSLSGIDSGSSFAAIGGSRELTIGVLVEPLMMLSLMMVALLAGSTDPGTIGAAISGGHVTSLTATIAAGLAFAFAIYIELGKLPYDMAEAEQELQEGPLMEYSGPSFALLKWSLSLKQVVVVGWFIGLFLPFGSATTLALPAVFFGLAVFAGKLLLVFLAVGLVENSVARVRFRFAPQHSWVGVGIASLAFVFYLVGL